MGSEILVYLRLGFEHIADPRGYDHILFIVALTVMYPPREWLRVLVLVTAFTVGHTITLVLATLGLVRISSDLVEFLIPVTILATALLNGLEMEWNLARQRDSEGWMGRVFGAGRESEGGGEGEGEGEGEGVTAGPSSEAAAPFEPRRGRRLKYLLAMGFGLIHGLGFSNFLRAALGAEANIAIPLLSFNVGLELGQICIVATVSVLTGIVTGWWRVVSRRAWVLMLSGATAAVAAGLAVQRWPW